MWHVDKLPLTCREFESQVGFGQTICTPVRPRCGECAVNNLCPAAFKELSKSPSRRVKSALKVKSTAKTSVQKVLDTGVGDG